MRADLFDYELPEAQIAKHPLPERDAGRLLMLEPTGISHHLVRDWVDLVTPGSLVVLNNTKVMPARLHGAKLATGGKLELLLLGPAALAGAWQAIGRSSKSFKPGQVLSVGEGTLEVVQVAGDGELVVRATGALSIEQIMRKFGETPIPPYLKRDAVAEDRERYQTVFAAIPGSVAAPTAGLHLTSSMLARLASRDVELGHLTLHVGVGTFRPVSAPTLAEHVMHAEYLEVSPQLVAQIARARLEQRRVVAVGTTVVRALESAALAGSEGLIQPFQGTTRLFLKPGSEFRVVDALLTNFHMPQSTLLMLVAAFAGFEPTMSAYRHAVIAGYRFLSYGDAMWIPRQGEHAV